MVKTVGCNYICQMVKMLDKNGQMQLQLSDCLLWNLNCSSKLYPLDRLGSVSGGGGGVKLLGLSERALGVELITCSS